MGPSVPVWESAAGAIGDSFRLFPAAFRTGWPVLILVPMINFGLAQMVIDAGGDSAIIWALLPFISLFLFMPVYVRLVGHVAAEELLPGWFSYWPGGKALAAVLAAIIGGVVLIIFLLLFLTPATLAVSAEIGTALKELVGEAGGWISIFGIKTSDIEEMIPLKTSPLGAGVLAVLGLIAFLWLWVKLSLIMPRAALYGHMLPYGASFHLTRGHFWQLLLAKILFFIMLLVLQVIFSSIAGVVSFALLGILMLGGNPMFALMISFALTGIVGLWLMAAMAGFHGRIYRAATQE